MRCYDYRILLLLSSIVLDIITNHCYHFYHYDHRLVSLPQDLWNFQAMKFEPEKSKMPRSPGFGGLVPLGHWLPSYGNPPLFIARFQGKSNSVCPMGHVHPFSTSQITRRSSMTFMPFFQQKMGGSRMSMERWIIIIDFGCAGDICTSVTSGKGWNHLAISYGSTNDY